MDNVVTSPPPFRPGWLGDFAWTDGKVRVRKTGVVLAVDRHLVSEVASWLIYFLVLGVAASAARLGRRHRLAIWYAPERPRPWYLMRGVALWAGIGVARSESGADAAFYFDDVTRGAPPAADSARRFNFACLDVSKTHVATVFEEVFGYPLRVDPTTAIGPIVEKSDTNGVHDGRIVTAPMRPRPGQVYQRLIDTTDDNGFGYDLRTPCVGGSPVVVWVKTKPAGERFAIHNRKAVLSDPGDVFSSAELGAIRHFNARMGLDWGGLDILRDREDGRIYIVDANKTDVGPVIALSWRDKIVSMGRLATALEALVAGRNSPPDADVV